jgi:hypothetical protein
MFTNKIGRFVSVTTNTIKKIINISGEINISGTLKINKNHAVFSLATTGFATSALVLYKNKYNFYDSFRVLRNGTLFGALYGTLLVTSIEVGAIYIWIGSYILAITPFIATYVIVDKFV